MAASSEYVEFLLDQLARWGGVSARRMFGGGGLFRDGLMFGLIADDQLFLKSGPGNLPDFEAEGCAPFLYEGKSRTVKIAYYTVPDHVIEDAEEFTQWSRKAFAEALAADKGKKSAKKKAVKSPRSKTTKASRPK